MRLVPGLFFCIGAHKIGNILKWNWDTDFCRLGVCLVPVVGIPRALLFYHYYPLWREFLTGLGVKVIESGPTTRTVVQQGLAAAVDETCLPVKTFYGHVLFLKDRVDYIFIPRLVSVEKRAYICPKFLGLPDMVSHSLSQLPQVLAPTIDLSRGFRGLPPAVLETGRLLGVGTSRAWLAFRTALIRWRQWQKLQYQGMLPLEALTVLDHGKGETGMAKDDDALQVGVLGHPYNLYDAYTNLGILDRLGQLGVRVITPEMLPSRSISRWARKIPKESFWTLGRQVFGAAGHLLADEGTDGLIHLVSFGCGPDSLIGELVERRARQGEGFPFLLLTLDEHSGEAGINTRLEAFVDTLKWRKEKDEGDLSPHGSYQYSS